MRLKLAVIALREREAMPSLFDPKTRDAILDRIGRLAPDRKPLWGRFTAPEMVCHVSCDLRQSLWGARDRAGLWPTEPCATQLAGVRQQPPIAMIPFHD